MSARSSGKRRSLCPISVALEMVGDAWSLLIVRDLMFRGRKTFNDFLGGEEAIASNILADRLARLEDNGILTKRRDKDDARRFVYRLTAKGIDLAPMLVEMVQWSARHEETAAPPQVLRAMRRDRDGFVARIRAEWAAGDK